MSPKPVTSAPKSCTPLTPNRDTAHPTAGLSRPTSSAAMVNPSDIVVLFQPNSCWIGSRNTETV